MPITKQVSTIKNAPSLFNEYNPFGGFLYKRHGLRSFQPTLLWVVQFGKFKSDPAGIIYTDNITVPSENVQLAQAENYWGNIPFPIGDARSTSNQFSVGIYVDIFSTIEKDILPIVYKFSRNGNKDAELKQQIDLYGYRMGTPTTGKEYTFQNFEPGSATPKTLKELQTYSLPNPSVKPTKFERACYIHYKFKDCIPITVDEYTYNHKNMAWANVRNVTFAFKDYEIEVVKQENIDNDEKLDPENLKFTSPVDPKKGYFRKAGRQEENKNFFFSENTPLFEEEIKPADARKNFSSNSIYAINPENLAAARITPTVTTDLGKLVAPSVANDMYYWEPNIDLTSDNSKRFPQKSEKPPTSKEFSDLQKTVLNAEGLSTAETIVINQETHRFIGPNYYDHISQIPTREELKWNKPGTIEKLGGGPDEGMFVEPVKTKRGSYVSNPYDEIKGLNPPELQTSADEPIRYKGGIYDTPTPSDNRDSLIKTVLKTAIKKFLIPDTPLYNSGTGMSWSPGFMKTVSKGIRQIQSIFYTEPRQKDIPLDDVPMVNTHTGGNTINIDPNDVPMMHTHTNGNKIKIDQYDHTTPITHKADRILPVDSNDYTTIENHGKPNNIKIDPNDYTSINNHGKPNGVTIDPNDYTTQGQHGKPNGVTIDPNDYTTQGQHGNPNGVTIDPNDYTKQGQHGKPNNVAIDQNDYVDSANVSFAENKIDENDVPVTSEIKANEKAINPNDTVDSQTLKTNQKPVDSNDFVSSEEVKIDEKQIAGDDTVTDFGGLDINTRKIAENDYPDGGNIKYTDVNTADEKMNSQLIESFDLQKIPEDSKMEFENQNAVPTGKNDNITKHDMSQANIQTIDRNDTVQKYKDIQAVVMDDKDKLTSHKKPENIVTPDGNDTVDAQSLVTDNKPVETSFIDFARMLVDLKKSEQDTVKMDKMQIKEVIDHGEKTPDHKNRVNLVGNTEKEIDTINPTHRNKGRLVDVHQDDHTEIIK